MFLFIKPDDETKPLVKKEEPDATEPKQEPMETEDKKPEIKTEPKEEEEGGANGTSASSSPQSRKKSKNPDLIYVTRSIEISRKSQRLISK